MLIPRRQRKSKRRLRMKTLMMMTFKRVSRIIRIQLLARLRWKRTIKKRKKNKRKMTRRRRISLSKPRKVTKR